NRGEDDRQHQGPESKMKLKKTASSAAGNESDNTWKSQASAAAGSSEICRVTFAADDQSKVDRQLGYVCCHHRGRRKPGQVECDQRILCGHGSNSDHADRYCNCAVRIGERAKPGA